MFVNKDIIIRIIIGFVIFVVFLKVVGPIIFEILKGKLLHSNPENDIDIMIKRQKERLRSQYGITGGEVTSSDNLPNHTATHSPIPSKEIQSIYKETRWGGGDFAKNIQNEIAKHYSLTLADSKINAFILLAEKRNYLRFLSSDHQKSPEAIKNFLSLVMLNLMLIEEIRNKEFYLLDRVAKKGHVSPFEMMLALQLKILSLISAKKELREERLYPDTPTLNQYSEETIKDAFDSLLKKEANMWARGHSHYFEELALLLTYAQILAPLPKIGHKNDLETAYAILKVGADDETEDIKRIYKKIAMSGHPDKIGQMKLPKLLEKKALEKFNLIQEAYQIINIHRKK